MFGYPWESDSDAKNTLKVLHDLLRKGIVKTAQASFYKPEGTHNISNEAQRKYVGEIYKVALFPDFWIRKIKSMKTGDDLKYFFRQIREGLFHG
jgi:hypothetical protein